MPLAPLKSVSKVKKLPTKLGGPDSRINVSKSNTSVVKRSKSESESYEAKAMVSNVTDEVDALFGMISKSKQSKKDDKEVELAKEKAEKKLAIDIAERMKLAEVEFGAPKLIISPDAAVHRWDKESGLPVYKYTALKVGDGGGTPLCPFDCDCCF